jgi:hypothetical protein
MLQRFTTVILQGNASRELVKKKLQGGATHPGLNLDLNLK